MAAARLTITLLLLGLPLWSEAKNCTITGIGLTPSTYVRAGAHTTAGLAAKVSIVPRTASGTPSPSGLIGMIGIGMSNAKQAQTKFYQIMQVTFGGDPDRHPAFRFILAAQNGKSAESWSVAGDAVWATAQTIVVNTGLTKWQVQAAHVMMTQKYPLTSGGMTAGQVQQILANLVAEFPNIQIIFLSGINYTGYSNDPALPLVDQTRAPEPFPHDDSLVLAGQVGLVPQWTDFTDLWADGTTPNPLTGLTYVCADIESDGVHLVASTGAKKVGYSLRDRWKADPVTQGWMFQ